MTTDKQSKQMLGESLTLLEQEYEALKKVLLQKRLSYYMPAPPHVAPEQRFTKPLSQLPAIDWDKITVTDKTPISQILEYIQAYWLVQVDVRL